MQGTPMTAYPYFLKGSVPIPISSTEHMITFLSSINYRKFFTKYTFLSSQFPTLYGIYVVAFLKLYLRTLCWILINNKKDN